MCTFRFAKRSRMNGPRKLFASRALIGWNLKTCQTQISRCFQVNRHIGIWFGERLDTLFTSSDSKISGFTRPHVIGFVADLFFSTLESGLIFFSGFAVEFTGYVWTVTVSGLNEFGGCSEIWFCIESYVVSTIYTILFLTNHWQDPVSIQFTAFSHAVWPDGSYLKISFCIK